MAATRMIITGGHGSLARSIASFFSTHSPDLEILSPGRDECDVTNSAQCHEYFRSQPCDLLIYAAGKSDQELLAKSTSATWDEIIDVNLHAAARCAKEVSRGMIKQRCGHIIFLSSYSAIHPPAGQVAYASAKAGLIGLTKSLAKEWGRANIRVNAILPGFLDNPMTQSLSDSRKQAVLEQHTLGRLNTEHAVAALLHTLHFSMPHTSGQIFNLDSRIL